MVIENGSGKIYSELTRIPDCSDEPEEYNTACDVIESIILAHACAGIDVSSKEYVEGITTTYDALGNNL